MEKRDLIEEISIQELEQRIEFSCCGGGGGGGGGGGEHGCEPFGDCQPQ